MLYLFAFVVCVFYALYMYKGVKLDAENTDARSSVQETVLSYLICNLQYDFCFSFFIFLFFHARI